MRARYDSNGGQLRLSAESKKLLNLIEPSQWTLDNLIAAQPHVITPLLKYWSERSSYTPVNIGKTVSNYCAELL